MFAKISCLYIVRLVKRSIHRHAWVICSNVVINPIKKWITRISFICTNVLLLFLQQSPGSSSASTFTPPSPSLSPC